MKRIKSKVVFLKKVDINFSVFGSSSHKYQFNDVVSANEIALFENKHGVKLPVEYKEFLLNLGNGGVGPYYGLYPLEKYRDHYNDHLWEDEDLARDYLNVPFKRTERWIPEPIVDEPEQDFEGLYGTISICHEGCGYLFTIIVNGEGYGDIWFDAMVSRQGIMPLINNESNRRYSFFEWYESWLDKEINKIVG